MNTKSVISGVRLDGPTYQALRALAEARTDGNASLIVRQLVRKEAALAGIWPPAPLGQNVTLTPATEAQR